MISFEQYRLLHQSAQAELLWLEGVDLVLTRQTPSMNIELYALYDYYVEIIFDKPTGEPLCLNAFKNQKHLAPYLSLIDIDALFQPG